MDEALLNEMKRAARAWLYAAFASGVAVGILAAIAWSLGDRQHTERQMYGRK